MSNAATPMTGLLESEFFDVYSGIVNDQFRIFVAKPPFVTHGRHPVIYVADGNTLFSQVMGIQRTLAWGAEAPAAYVIGIGYPTEHGFLPAMQSAIETTRLQMVASMRVRCFSPMMLPEQTRSWAFSGTRCGHCSARYGIDSDDSTFVGVSLGGLFGAWALLKATDMFHRYVLTSPALWWNDEEVWRWEHACAEKRGDIRAKVFLSAGGLEFPAALREHALQISALNPMLKPQVDSTIAWHDTHGWPRTKELIRALAEKIEARSYPNLRILAHDMPDETHMSVAPAAICRGLRYVFDRWSPW